MVLLSEERKEELATYVKTILTNDVHPVSRQPVLELVQDQGYGLQVNVKTSELTNGYSIFRQYR